MVAVFDLSGRQVARLLQARFSAGWHRLAWDGVGPDGRPAPNGIHLVRVSAGGSSRAERRVLLR